MIWTIFTAICFARFFYTWGYDNGAKHYVRRSEKMLARMEAAPILDAPPVAQRQPLRAFGSMRPDVRLVK